MEVSSQHVWVGKRTRGGKETATGLIGEALYIRYSVTKSAAVTRAATRLRNNALNERLGIEGAASSDAVELELLELEPLAPAAAAFALSRSLLIPSRMVMCDAVICI